MDLEKKSQAPALEFFITYGWAIMVILVGLGIVIYFGLINIEGSTCKIAPKLNCKEFNIEQDRVTLTIQNRMDQLLLGVDVGVEGCEEMDTGNILDKGREETFIMNSCDFKIGDEIDNLVNFTYIDQNGQPYIKIGKIKKKVS